MLGLNRWAFTGRSTAEPAGKRLARSAREAVLSRWYGAQSANPAVSKLAAVLAMGDLPPKLSPMRRWAVDVAKRQMRNVSLLACLWLARATRVIQTAAASPAQYARSGRPNHLLRDADGRQLGEDAQVLDKPLAVAHAKLPVQRAAAALRVHQPQPLQVHARRLHSHPAQRFDGVNVQARHSRAFQATARHLCGTVVENGVVSLLSLFQPLTNF